MAIERQFTGSHGAGNTQPTYTDELTDLADELESLLDEMKQTLEIVRFAMAEVEAP